MIIVLIAISAALALCVVSLVALLPVRARRAARRADVRLATAIAPLEARIEELHRELGEALARADAESRRAGFLREIAGSIDLDEVLARTLETATATEGVDAALVRLEAESDGKAFVATLGLSVDEAERQALSGPPDGRRARAIRISYMYTGEEAGEGDPVHGGLAVPIAGGPAEQRECGFLVVFSRSAAREFGEEDVRRLEDLADLAGPAIDNARRFREARQLADLDALTGLHNRRYFHETLAREVARAQRYQRRLALIVFDLDDFKKVNDRVGHLAGDAVLAEAAERVRDVVRRADIACRVGGDEFAVILPESTLADADQLYRRIQGAVAARSVGPVGQLYLSAGVAELKPEDDAVVFFERADEALYRAKESGKGRAVQANSGHGA